MWRLLILIILLSACAQPMQDSSGTEQQLRYTVNISSGCASSEIEKPEVFLGKNSLEVVAHLRVPNPCYNATVNVSRKGGRIVVEVNPEKLDTICIQCLGRLDVRVKLVDLEPGRYYVEVLLPGESYVYEAIVR